MTLLTPPNFCWDFEPCNVRSNSVVVLDVEKNDSSVRPAMLRGHSGLYRASTVYYAPPWRLTVEQRMFWWPQYFVGNLTAHS